MATLLSKKKKVILGVNKESFRQQAIYRTNGLGERVKDGSKKVSVEIIWLRFISWGRKDLFFKTDWMTGLAETQQ